MRNTHLRPPRALAGRLIAGLALLAMAHPASASSTAATSAEFAAAAPSSAARRLADWVVSSGDNQGLAFALVDKSQAQVFVFRADGGLVGMSAALLGLAHGDVSAPGIGQRKLSAIRPDERTTPAGRFVASLGRNLAGHDILWVDYEAAISLHAVVTSNPKERRLVRLETPTAADNRISYGCINVPAAFFAQVVRPTFSGANAVVYVLPEVLPLTQVFPGLGGVATGPPPRR